ncbi:MAG: PIN domain-containing protein [Desulfomonilaceae bacterium]
MTAEKRYWDSCCFLGYFKGERDKEESCRAVLKEAKKGNILIITSALTLAEVVNLKRATPIPVEDAKLLQKAFKEPYLRVRNVDEYIAELARKMVWEYGFQPKDSIHIATAMKHKIPFFDTFDEELIRLSGTMSNPPMRIGKPNVIHHEQVEIFEVSSSRVVMGEDDQENILLRKFEELS